MLIFEKKVDFLSDVWYPGRRDRLFQEDLIVVTIRDQLSAHLIESSNRGTVAGWIPVFVAIGCRDVIDIGLAGDLFIGDPVFGKIYENRSIQCHTIPSENWH